MSAAKIEEARKEADQHGDHAMVTVCEQALAGDADALKSVCKILKISAKARVSKGRSSGRAYIGPARKSGGTGHAWAGTDEA